MRARGRGGGEQARTQRADGRTGVWGQEQEQRLEIEFSRVIFAHLLTFLIFSLVLCAVCCVPHTHSLVVKGFPRSYLD